MSVYNLDYIVICEDGKCYAYMNRSTMEGRVELNYGEHKAHYFKFIGNWNKEDLRMAFPNKKIKIFEDSKLSISKFLKEKLAELQRS